MWEYQERKLLSFRCHIGHAYTQDNLLLSKAASVEAVLWSALRVIEERIALMHRLTDQARVQGLQSTNEELETTNEELQTINDESNRRSEAHHEVSVFLESIMASLRSGVVIVNRELEILIWNDSAADLWGLRSDEVKGKHFLNLDIGLPVAELKPLLRACIAGESEPAEIDLPAMNRRGKKLLIRVRCTPLLGDKKARPKDGIMFMEEAEFEQDRAKAKSTGAR